MMLMRAMYRSLDTALLLERVKVAMKGRTTVNNTMFTPARKERRNPACGQRLSFVEVTTEEVYLSYGPAVSFRDVLQEHVIRLSSDSQNEKSRQKRNDEFITSDEVEELFRCICPALPPFVRLWGLS